VRTHRRPFRRNVGGLDGRRIYCGRWLIDLGSAMKPLGNGTDVKARFPEAASCEVIKKPTSGWKWAALRTKISSSESPTSGCVRPGTATAAVVTHAVFGNHGRIRRHEHGKRALAGFEKSVVVHEEIKGVRERNGTSPRENKGATKDFSGTRRKRLRQDNAASAPQVTHGARAAIQLPVVRANPHVSAPPPQY